MQMIHVIKFGRACGFAGALLYMGCVISMAFLGHDAIIVFANSFFHHLDVSSIIKDSPMGWGEILMGTVEFFVICWLAGASVAAIYNYSLLKEKTKHPSIKKIIS